MSVKTTLKLAEKINNGQTAVDDYVVPSGKTTIVRSGNFQVPDSAEASIRVCWGGDIMWVVQRSDNLPPSAGFAAVGDGVKKIELIADNECSGNYYFAALLNLRTDDT